MRARERIKDTSVQAYYAMVNGPELSRQQKAIIDLLTRRCERDWTRNEIAQALDMRLSSVCGRVNELVAKFIVVEGDRRPDGITGVSAHPVSLAPVQSDLFAA